MQHCRPCPVNSISSQYVIRRSTTYECVTLGCGCCIEVLWWLCSVGWINKILVDEVLVTARLVCLVQGFDEGVIEAKYIVVVMYEFVDECIICKCVTSNAWIVGQSSAQIEVFGIVLVQHGVGDVRDVPPSVGFSSNIDLEVLDAEDCLKVLEETDEVCGNVIFVGGSDFTNREADTNRLFHPQHVGQVHPGVWIRYSAVHAPSPFDVAILLKPTFQGRAS